MPHWHVGESLTCGPGKAGRLPRDAAQVSARSSELRFAEEPVKLSRIGIPFVIALTLGLGSAQEASAQASGFGIGYQFVRLNTFELNYPIGINVDGAVPVSGPLSVIGEFGWSRHPEDDDTYSSNVINLGGGVRLSGMGATTPYGQVVVGYQRDNDEFLGDSENFNSFYTGIDGGVQARGLFAQVGYRRVAYEGDGANGFRFVIGFRSSR